jgi:glycosyltransferase involved in cell wall biosynthesis
VKDFTYLGLKNTVGSIFDLTTVHVSDRVICPSPGLAQDLMLYCHVNKEKIRVVENGIDLEAFDKTECEDSTVLDKYNIQKENFLLYIGRLSFRKGLQYLIEAFKIVQKQHPNLKLVIVGRGDYEQQLRKIARNTKGIVFTGYVEDKTKKLLCDASLAVILPSAYEVLPITLLETMASSKPVIVSNVDGNNYVVKHGKNGFLSKHRDPVDIAKYINILFEDRALRRKMGAIGRKMVETEFTIEKMVNETLETYESLLD